MPDDAYRASLFVAGTPRGIRPASEITLQVEVTNVSMFDWIQREYGVFSVGNHWFDGAGGRMLTRDDGRTRLPAILRAGEKCRLSLTINAPPSEGTYQCEVDVAHEDVLWFHDRGSEAVRLAVRVGDDEMDSGAVAEGASQAGAPSQATAAADGESPEIPRLPRAQMDVDDPGEFPMYGVPLHSVVGLLTEHGATLLHIENDRSCGDDWVSYRYFVRAAE